MTLDDVAERMTCSTSKISRLETGKGVPKVPDVSELMRIYGLDSDTERALLLRLVRDGREHGWWETYTEGVQSEPHFLDRPGRYASLENDARRVRCFDFTSVHGLLQTEDYMRAVFARVLVHHTAEDVDRLVALRTRRQQALVRQVPRPLELVAVMDEVVLRRPVGGAAVMAAQLDRLVEVGRLPNVTVHVVPHEAGILRAHAGQFVLLDIPTELGSDIVFVEGHAGDSYLDSDADLALYQEVFADALASALSPRASAELIGGYRAVLGGERG